MKQALIMLKKEFFHSKRNGHVYMLVALFTFLGILNVLTAKYTPLLMEYLVSKELAQAFPKPTGGDVWVQFNKNVTQMGLFVVVIMYSTILTKEVQNGSLSLLLTKGLARKNVLLGKWLWMVLSFSLYYTVSVGVTIFYTWFYFETIFYGKWQLALLAVWLFSVFVLTFLLFSSVYSSQSYSVLLSIGGLILVLFLLHLITKIQFYNPMELISQFTKLMGASDTNGLKASVLTTIGAIFALLGGSLLLFERKTF